MHIPRWSMWDCLYSDTVPGRLFLSSGRTLWQVAGLGLCVSVAPYVNAHYYHYHCYHWHYHYYAWKSYVKPQTCLLKLLHWVYYESGIALVVEKYLKGHKFCSHPMVVPTNISCFNNYHCWKLPTLLCSIHICYDWCTVVKKFHFQPELKLMSYVLYMLKP